MLKFPFWIIATIMVFSCISLVDAFIFQHKRHRNQVKMETYWEEVDFERKTNEDCVCGKYVGNGIKPWNVFINISNDDFTSFKLCTGTIVTSNLIVTSHKCFLLPDKKMNIYDLWKPKHAERNAVWDTKLVMLSTSKEKGEGVSFKVDEIIYSSHYSLKSAAEVYPPEFDIAILYVSEGFTAHYPNVTPICLPNEDKTADTDMSNVEGYYYGIEADMHDNPDIHFGAIKPENHEECSHVLKANTSMETGFCYRFAGSGSFPITEGGPLYVDSEDTSTGFLIGLAALVKTEMAESGFDYAYFTNLISLIKYVEYKAEKYQSTWCKTPADFVLTRRKNVTRDDGTEREPWPWEVTKEVAERDESLDCTCGIQMQGKMMGRVVGGEDAKIDEFPWMVLIYIYTHGRESGFSLCGGTIINNQLILSAAHCVVNEDKARQGVLPMTVAPENVDIFLQVHDRDEDDKEQYKQKVRAILYHPEYAYAKAEGYFDYDVALFVLKEPLPLGKKIASDTDDSISRPTKIKPICLPKPGAPYINLVGRTSTVAGWGLTDPEDHHSAASRMQKIDLPIQDLDMCRIADSKVTDRNICAGTLNMYKDAASGDSGGPLMVKETAGYYTEYGIVSWAEDVDMPNGETKTAALYADVQKLLDFIDYHAQRIHAKWCRYPKQS